MSLWDNYVNMVREVHDARAGRMPTSSLLERQRQANTLMDQAYGQRVGVEGQMASNEFDEQGNVINPRSSTSQSTQLTGLLGNPNDPQALNNYRRAAAAAGLQGEEIQRRISDTQRVGVFKNKTEQMAANRNMKQDFRKEIAPYRAKVQYYDDTLALGDYKNWKGPDDFIAMRNLLKQSLPNESVMGDDLANLTVSGGMPAWAESLIAKLTGKGMQGVEARRDMLATMKKNAVQGKKFADEIRAGYKLDATNTPGLNTNFMRAPIEINDWGSTSEQNVVDFNDL